MPRPRRTSGDRGFVLLFVLALVAIFALVGLAIFAYTDTTGQVSNGLAASMARTREIDGALDTAVNQIRPKGLLDASGFPQPCVGDPAVFSDVFGATDASHAPAFPDVTNVGCSNNNTTISGASNASPIVVTLAATPSGGALATGEKVTISGVVGNTAANGTWVVTSVGGTSFSLNGSTGNGAYASGGTVLRSGVRDLTISVCSGGACPGVGKLLGQTRVLFTDTVGTGNQISSVPGYTLDVCDWQVGAAVSSTVNPC